MLLVRTAVAPASICHTSPRRWAAKSAPVEAVSELPLVPTNDAPICASHSGGGGGAAAGGCGGAGRGTVREKTRIKMLRREVMKNSRGQRSYHRAPPDAASAGYSQPSTSAGSG